LIDIGRTATRELVAHERTRARLRQRDGPGQATDDGQGDRQLEGYTSTASRNTFPAYPPLAPSKLTAAVYLAGANSRASGVQRLRSVAAAIHGSFVQDDRPQRRRHHARVAGLHVLGRRTPFPRHHHATAQHLRTRRGHGRHHLRGFRFRCRPCAHSEDASPANRGHPAGTRPGM
jgi:hypothetical protein